MKEKISMIVPLYNCEQYISRCLLSIKKQTYRNYEVIIVDDGSTDNSAEVVKNIIKNEKKFKYYFKENSGVSTARNYGIEKSTGEWITFIDADDFITSDYLENLISRTNKNTDFVIANHMNYYSENKKSFSDISDEIVNIKKTLLLNILDETYSNKINKNNYKSSRTVWGKLYRKSIITKNKIMFEKGIKLFEDGLFNIEYLNQCNNIEVCKDVIYKYYISPTSATTKYYPNRIDEDSKKIKKVYKLIENYMEDQDFKNAYSIFCFNLFCSYLKNTLYNKQNSQSKKDKTNQLKVILKNKKYGNFKFNTIKYLKSTKKIILILVKLKLNSLITLIMEKR